VDASVLEEEARSAEAKVSVGDTLNIYVYVDRRGHPLCALFSRLVILVVARSGRTIARRYRVCLCPM
jgi:hypothetical protein